MKNNEIHIKVIGVGGSGGKAVNHIARLNKGRAQFIIIDTNQTVLNELDVEGKILIGQHLTNGYGSAANPEIDARTQFIFDEGHRIGELAKQFFPDGIDLDYEKDLALQQYPKC